MFAKSMIEYAAFLYLRTLSLNNTVDIIQAWFSQEILSKDVLLNHIIQLIDKLPSFSTVTQMFKPMRSGYYAWDGLWLKYLGEDFVLLVCFDVETLDIINYQIAEDEIYDEWKKLADKIENTEPQILSSAKGFFADGELGLMKLLKNGYSQVPLQLCAFHRYSRIGQIISFKRAKGIHKIIKTKVEKVIFAKSKYEAIQALAELKRYAQVHQKNKKLREAIGVLKRNFDLLLTHFDNPQMSAYNNALEGFNHIVKRKLRLMKGFKSELNTHRWLKLILLDYRFHKIKTSKFPYRNGKSPLQLADVKLPKYFNWIKMVGRKLSLKKS